MDSVTVVAALANTLEQIIAAHSHGDQRRSTVTDAFSATDIPSITLHEYLSRIAVYSSCSVPAMIIGGLILVDRIITRGFVLTEMNVHRVVLTGIMLAAKINDDEFYSNGYFSRIGGIPVEELNTLELELLFRLEFNTHVHACTFGEYSNRLVVFAHTLTAPRKKLKVLCSHQQVQEPKNIPQTPPSWVQGDSHGQSQSPVNIAKDAERICPVPVAVPHNRISNRTKRSSPLIETLAISVAA